MKGDQQQENQPLQDHITTKRAQRPHSLHATRQSPWRLRILIAVTVLFLVIGLILTVIGLARPRWSGKGFNSDCAYTSCEKGHEETLDNCRIAGPLFLAIGGILLIFTVCSACKSGSESMRERRDSHQPVQGMVAHRSNNPPSIRGSFQDPAYPTVLCSGNQSQPYPPPSPSLQPNPHPPSPFLQPYPSTHSQHLPLMTTPQPYIPNDLDIQPMYPSATLLQPENLSPPPSYSEALGVSTGIGSEGNVV